MNKFVSTVDLCLKCKFFSPASFDVVHNIEVACAVCRNVWIVI